MSKGIFDFNVISPSPTRTKSITIPDQNPIESFKSAMTQYGLPSVDIICDGEMHRFGDKNKDCYYSLHSGKFHFGIFGNWSIDNGVGVKWCSRNVAEMSTQDIADHEKILEGNRIKLKAIKKERHAKAKAEVQALWNRSPKAITHQYLTDKGVDAYGLKISGNELLVPMRDKKGDLCSLQRINKDKRFYPGGKVVGCTHTIPGDNSFYLCEGYATACTIHEATGGTVIIAFNAGNLKVVAKRITKPFIIVADNDCWKSDNSNPGVDAAEKAKRAANVECKIIIPQFKDITGFPTDINDLAANEGLSVVKTQLNPVATRLPLLTMSDINNMSIPEEPCMLSPWLKVNSVNQIYGARGCGKSFFILSLLDAVTRNVPFLGWECHASVPCLYLDGEMTMRDDQKRIRELALHTKRKNPLYLLSNEHLVKQRMPSFSLADAEARQSLKETMLSAGIKLWVADNFASLTPGLDENSKQDWDPINSWLLDLRFNGITTIGIHHAGKSGLQRGTSAREDNLDSVIKVSRDSDGRDEGAKFTVSFEKNRGVDSDGMPLIKDQEIKLIRNESGILVFAKCGTELSKANKEIAILFDQGKSGQEIAEKLSKSHQYIYKVKKELIEKKVIIENGSLTDKWKQKLFPK